MQAISTEILINAYQVTRYKTGDVYEFVLNQHLELLHCVKIQIPTRGILRPIINSKEILKGMLFELNHVRVNPKLDNDFIIQSLTKAFDEIGVNVFKKPEKNSMQICYKPLGEISDCVRFFINPEGKFVFLSPAMRPKLVASNKF